MTQSSAVVSAHLQRLHVAHEMLPGALPGINRVRYLHSAQPAVSIIIPTRDQLPLINGLIDSLLAKTSYTNYELLIVDNDSRDPAACAYLDGIAQLNSPQLRVLRYPHPFNYSAINNFAAAQARGEYLILLNNDTAVIQDDWIEQLLNHAQRPEVGIVGAKLHYPDGRIQHGGVILGLRGPADHPFIGLPGDATGYMHRLQVDQNYTAVTAACLMIRASVYAEVGGLDEQHFKVSYNDVDLCLKVNQAGYLTVWTPYARLMHEGSVSQTKVDTTAQAAKQKRFQSEQHAMYRKWLPLLARDPMYNRNLNLDGVGFELDPQPQRAWQPFVTPLAPRLFCVAADAQGCGHYRIRQPFTAMQRAGLAEGMLADAHLEPIAMERFQADTIVLQRQVTTQQLKRMQNYRDFNRAFKVYELDDYLPNVPMKSAFRNALPKDVLKALRKGVALTDRFVVSTAPLAEQFASLHSDIRVVRNRLPVDWWGSLDSQRRVGPKPRIGWGGGASHRGDLELIADVVRDLADEVEWVFFGMCPDKLKPYVHEFHAGVPIEQYPAKLASLNLDLALAPLEENIFNICKSNLRLLEYGACGFPVVCSDIVCYQGDELPVTRVRNRYKDWVGAIRMHLDDLDATAAAGDALRAAVQRDWMLNGDHLLNWRKAWLPD
jgi:GT2 family glycosyltransferase